MSETENYSNLSEKDKRQKIIELYTDLGAGGRFGGQNAFIESLKHRNITGLSDKLIRNVLVNFDAYYTSKVSSSKSYRSIGPNGYGFMNRLRIFIVRNMLSFCT